MTAPALAGLAAREAALDEVHVTAPARLHFGLLNESGLFGRIDGGVGVAVADPAWRYCLRPAARVAVRGAITPELAAAAEHVITRLTGELRLQPFELVVIDEIPAHAGLGSKTALLVSIGRALFDLAGRTPSEYDVARAVGRGGTSGMGTYLSREGGLAVDLGRGFPRDKSRFVPSSASASAPPLLLAQLGASACPVVHFRFDAAGPSGAAERAVFERACPVPEPETAMLLARTMSQIIPGYLEGEDAALQSGLEAIQHLGLKRHEWAAQSPVTQAFRAHFRRAAPDLALCLSSMGPTMFVFAEAPQRVLDVIDAFAGVPVHLCVTGVGNGAEFHTRPSESACWI